MLGLKGVQHLNHVNDRSTRGSDTNDEMSISISFEVLFLLNYYLCLI